MTACLKVTDSIFVPQI